MLLSHENKLIEQVLFLIWGYIPILHKRSLFGLQKIFIQNLGSNKKITKVLYSAWTILHIRLALYITDVSS